MVAPLEPLHSLAFAHCGVAAVMSIFRLLVVVAAPAAPLVDSGPRPPAQTAPANEALFCHNCLRLLARTHNLPQTGPPVQNYPLAQTGSLDRHELHDPNQPQSHARDAAAFISFFLAFVHTVVIEIAVTISRCRPCVFPPAGQTRRGLRLARTGCTTQPERARHEPGLAVTGRSGVAEAARPDLAVV